MCVIMFFDIYFILQWLALYRWLKSLWWMIHHLKNCDAQLACCLCNIKQRKMENFYGNVSNVESNILFLKILTIALMRAGVLLDDTHVWNRISKIWKSKTSELYFISFIWNWIDSELARSNIILQIPLIQSILSRLFWTKSLKYNLKIYSWNKNHIWINIEY